MDISAGVSVVELISDRLMFVPVNLSKPEARSSPPIVESREDCEAFIVGVIFLVSSLRSGGY